MQYSREKYEGEQANLDRAANHDDDPQRYSTEASEIGKFADITYESVRNAFDYLRGRTSEQVKNRLDKLYNEAHTEALELNKQHESLQSDVLAAWSSFVHSVERIQSFESELLGKRK